MNGLNTTDLYVPPGSGGEVQVHSHAIGKGEGAMQRPGRAPLPGLTLSPGHRSGGHGAETWRHLQNGDRRQCELLLPEGGPLCDRGCLRDIPTTRRGFKAMGMDTSVTLSGAPLPHGSPAAPSGRAVCHVSTRVTWREARAGREGPGSSLRPSPMPALPIPGRAWEERRGGDRGAYSIG